MRKKSRTPLRLKQKCELVIYRPHMASEIFFLLLICWSVLNQYATPHIGSFKPGFPPI